jgi:hypothetical protein
VCSTPHAHQHTHNSVSAYPGMKPRNEIRLRGREKGKNRSTARGEEGAEENWQSCFYERTWIILKLGGSSLYEMASVSMAARQSVATNSQHLQGGLGRKPNHSIHVRMHRTLRLPYLHIYAHSTSKLRTKLLITCTLMTEMTSMPTPTLHRYL